MSSGTATFTGSNVFHDPGTGAPVLWGNGRQLVNNPPATGSLIEGSGRNDFTLYFYENDPAAFDLICAALAG
jgi:hypothetical protein